MAHACADSKLKRNHAPKTSDTVALEWPTPIVIIDSRKMTSMQNEATRAPTRRTVGPAASLPIRYATVPAPTTWSVDATVRPAVSSACRWKSVFSAAESVKSPPTFASMISASRRCESASHSRRRGASARRGSRSPEVSVFMVRRAGGTRRGGCLCGPMYHDHLVARAPIGVCRAHAAALSKAMMAGPEE